MEDKRVIGGDPGGDGALAVCTQSVGARHRKLVVVHHKLMHEWVRFGARSLEIEAAGIEKVASRPTDGKPQIFTFGRNTGEMISVMKIVSGLSAIPEVPIDDWQAHFRLQKWNLPYGTVNRKPFHKKALIKLMESGAIEVVGLRKPKNKGLIATVHTPETLIDSSVDACLIALYVFDKHYGRRLVDIL